MIVYIVKRMSYGYYTWGDIIVELSTLSRNDAYEKQDELMGTLDSNWNVFIEEYSITLPEGACTLCGK